MVRAVDRLKHDCSLEGGVDQEVRSICRSANTIIGGLALARRWLPLLCHLTLYTTSYINGESSWHTNNQEKIDTAIQARYVFFVHICN